MIHHFHVRQTFIPYHISFIHQKIQETGLFVRENPFSTKYYFKISSIYNIHRLTSWHHMLESERYQILSLKTFFFLLHQKTTMIKFYFYFIWRKGNHYIWVLIWKDVDRDKFLLYLLLECIDLFLGWYYENSVFILYICLCLYINGITDLMSPGRQFGWWDFGRFTRTKTVERYEKTNKIKLFSYHYFTILNFLQRALFLKNIMYI